MAEPDKPWWRTLNGEPEWMRGWDKPAPWHGWAYAAGTLLISAVALIFAPPHVLGGPLAGFGMFALAQAVRERRRS